MSIVVSQMVLNDVGMTGVASDLDTIDESMRKLKMMAIATVGIVIALKVFAQHVKSKTEMEDEKKSSIKVSDASMKKIDTVIDAAAKAAEKVSAMKNAMTEDLKEKRAAYKEREALIKKYGEGDPQYDTQLKKLKDDIKATSSKYKTEADKAEKLYDDAFKFAKDFIIKHGSEKDMNILMNKAGNVKDIKM